MTGSIGKIRRPEEKSPVEVRRNTAKIWDFRRISVFGAFLSGVLVVLMVGSVEIASIRNFLSTRQDRLTS